MSVFGSLTVTEDTSLQLHCIFVTTQRSAEAWHKLHIQYNHALPAQLVAWLDM